MERELNSLQHGPGHMVPGLKLLFPFSEKKFSNMGEETHKMFITESFLFLFFHLGNKMEYLQAKTERRYQL